MASKIKVLWVGDGGVATGFARVNHSIYGNLPKGKYEIHHLAINYRGDPYPDAKALLYPAVLGGDLFGIGRLKKMVENIKPDMIFILNDSWMIPQYLEQIPDTYVKKVVTYFPVDAKPLDSEWVIPISQLTVPVTYTEYAREAVLEHAPNADVRVIPHGIDRKVFHPVDSMVARKKLAGLTEDDFIFLNANRNQPRKRVDLTIKGFARFAKDKPSNVKLYLHMGIEDMGWHVIRLCDRFGIADRLVLSTMDLSPAKYVSDAHLNNIYNACDVGINTSMGEGWGLTSFEHGACGKAQIVPNSSACKEIYGEDRAILLPIDHYETYPQILTEGAVVTEDGIVEAMERYYSDTELREQHAVNLYEYITAPQFDWKNIAKQWDAIFEEVI